MPKSKREVFKSKWEKAKLKVKHMLKYLNNGIIMKKGLSGGKKHLKEVKRV